MPSRNIQKKLECEEISNQFLEYVYVYSNKITNDGFVMLIKAINQHLINLQQLSLFLPSNTLKIDESYSGLLNFTNLTHLRTFQLNLSFNQITSQGLITIFKDIGQLKTIQTLSLTFQSIKTNPVHFSKSIKNLLTLPSVQQFKLNFSSNSIRDQGMFTISDVMKKFTEMKKLEIILRSCQIQDKGFTEFVKQLSQRKQLKQLKINLLSNQLTQKCIKSINENNCLQNLISIKTLNLNFSNNPGLNDAAVRLLAKSLLLIKVFDSIDLTQKGCLYLGRFISQQLGLQDVQLSLKHNDIKLAGIQYICAGLLKVKRIKKLKICIQATAIGDQSANYLAMCLLKMRYLTNVDLNLDNCNLTNQAVENIIKTVKQCSRKAEEITINLRKNQELKLELYEQIKKDLAGSRIAIKLDNPTLEKNGSTFGLPRSNTTK